MCERCEARDADPRSRAFVVMGLLEVLSRGEQVKCQSGQTAYVVCSGVGDAAAAEAQAATMAITDMNVHTAKVRHYRVCLN